MWLILQNTAGIDSPIYTNQSIEAVPMNLAASAYESITKAIEAQKLVAEAMQGIWIDILGSADNPPSALYQGLVQTGLMFAVLGLAWYVMQFVQAFLEDEVAGMQKLFFPLLIILLLANNGYMLRNMTLGMKTLIDGATQQVLTKVSEESLVQLHQSISQQQGMLQLFYGQYQYCTEQLVNMQNTDATNPSTVTGDEVADCLVQLSQDMEAYNFASQLDNFLGDAWNSLKSAVSNAISNPLGVAGAVGTSLFNNYASFIIVQFLNGMAIAFQWAIEITLVFASLTGPIFTCGAMLPGQDKALWTYITGFFCIGLIKLGYNLMVGLTAMLIYKSNNSDVLIMPLLTGLFSPVLALGIGSLSFTQIFGILQGGASIAAKTALGAGGAVGGKVAQVGATRIGRKMGRTFGAVAGRLRNLIKR